MFRQLHRMLYRFRQKPIGSILIVVYILTIAFIYISIAGMQRQVTVKHVPSGYTRNLMPLKVSLHKSNQHDFRHQLDIKFSSNVQVLKAKENIMNYSIKEDIMTPTTRDQNKDGVPVAIGLGITSHKLDIDYNNLRKETILQSFPFFHVLNAHILHDCWKWFSLPFLFGLWH